MEKECLAYALVSCRREWASISQLKVLPSALILQGFLILRSYSHVAAELLLAWGNIELLGNEETGRRSNSRFTLFAKPCSWEHRSIAHWSVNIDNMEASAWEFSGVAIRVRKVGFPGFSSCEIRGSVTLFEAPLVLHYLELESIRSSSYGHATGLLVHSRDPLIPKLIWSVTGLFYAPLIQRVYLSCMTISFNLRSRFGLDLLPLCFLKDHQYSLNSGRIININTRRGISRIEYRLVNAEKWSTMPHFSTC